MIQTYTVPADRHREEARPALNQIPRNSQGWVMQKANQLIPEQERQQYGIGMHFNSRLLSSLAKLAQSAESREGYEQMNRFLEIRMGALGRDRVELLAKMPPRARAWALRMTEICVEYDPQIREHIMQLLYMIANECDEHNPPVELNLFQNKFIEKLQREPNQDITELLMNTRRELRLE